MAYTVKKVATLSGVSIRTLRFYDEIGLLKPAYYGDNKYRYYEEEQLLILQQILFFREMGLSLDDIQRTIHSDDFNKIDTLISHKRVLEQGLDRTQQLIKTIDKTIAHLRGKEKMKEEELYYGFDSEKQKQYEKDLVKEGVVSEEWMDKYKGKINTWTQEDKERFIQEAKAINEALIAAINRKLKPSDNEVQAIIRRHHAWVGWNPSQEAYLVLSKRYQTPEFKQFYDRQDPEFLEFIVEAMRVFAERELT